MCVVSINNPWLPDLGFLQGTLQLAEFLQSVTEAPLLVREGTVCPTSSFLDAQTRQVVVQMVAFAPDHGVASTIKITGDFGIQIQVRFVIEHFQALEGLLLTQYTWVTIMGMILALLILTDKLVTVYYMVGMEERTMFSIDIVIQVVLPIVYFPIRYSQITSSGKDISKIIGIDGLSGVPWADSSVELNSKMMRFFEGLDMFEKKIRRHFLLLLAVLFVGFLVLALAQFSGSIESFSNFHGAFEMLYDMMLGGLPDNWTLNPVMAVYVIFFNVLGFLTIFNFIIAIIVDSYAKVCQENEQLKADQEFFTDVADVFTVACNPAFFGWPSHLKLIENLQNSRKITLMYMDLHNMSSWKMKSIKAFMVHYHCTSKNNGSYMTEQPDLTEYLHGDLAKDVPTVDELERRMSVLFNQPCPTMAQRIQRFSHLNRMQKKVAKVCVPSNHAQFDLIRISHLINYFTRACTDPISKHADPGG